MLAPADGLLRAGLGIKIDQVKRATQSYVRDRAHQATDSVTSYTVAAGLFAAAGVFLIAACLVGITALFRWIEIRYGLFPAFGAVGALLLVVSAICAGVAAARLKRRPREFPSLASRLRVAVKASPLGLDRTGNGKDAAVLMASSAPPRRQSAPLDPGQTGRGMQIGLVLTAAFIGLAAARRRRLSRGAKT